MKHLTYLFALLAPVLLYITDREILRHSKHEGYCIHPQQGNTGNLLDILAGDTRALLSKHMLAKAESYYHGGISDHGDCDHDHDPIEADHNNASRSLLREDLFAYLNRRLHANTHIHLELEKADELMPWYWAAIEASPHNIQAIEAASYALSTMLEQPYQALLLLEKAIDNNPANVKLELTRGEVLIKHMKDFKRAEAAFQAAYEKSVKAKASHDDLDKAEALFYLGYLAKRKNDMTRLSHWQAIARESMSPDLLSIRNLLKIE